MTASSDSSSPLPTHTPIDPTQSLSLPEVPLNKDDTARPVGGKSPRSWLGLLALVLLAAGVGFAIWKALAGGEPEMQGPQAVPVKVERLQEESVEDSSEYIGTLESQVGVSLQPEADGRVVQIFVSSGDEVAAGDPIVQLSSNRSQADYNAALASVSAARSARDSARSNLRAAQERQAQLVADLDLQENDYRRTATLVEQGALAQEQLDQVERDRTVAGSALSSAVEEIAALQSSVSQAEATLDQANANANATQEDLLDKTVTAPSAGTVGDIPIDLGAYVTAGTQLATITQNRDLDIEIAVPIGESNRLQTGLPVELMLFGSDEVIATGNLNFVSPTTDISTQTVMAKARFSRPSQPLQDEQRLEVRVIWDDKPGILIPTTAISRLGGETFVFMPGEPDPPEAGEDSAGAPSAPQGQSGQPKGQSEGQSEGQSGQSEGPPPTVARLKSVKLGSLQGNDYQVLEGLAAGDTVIVSGLLNLQDGVPIAPEAADAESPTDETQSNER